MVDVVPEVAHDVSLAAVDGVAGSRHKDGSRNVRPRDVHGVRTARCACAYRRAVSAPLGGSFACPFERLGDTEFARPSSEVVEIDVLGGKDRYGVVELPI